MRNLESTRLGVFVLAFLVLWFEAAPARKSHTTLVANGATIGIKFETSKDHGQWSSHYLDAGKNSPLLTADSGFLFIRLTTHRPMAAPVSVEYRLDDKHRYQIFRNSTKDCWDVMTIRPR
jgi:hypothetical protein